MKLPALLLALALVLGSAPLFAQAPAGGSRGGATTQIERTAPEPPLPTSDSFTIPSRPAAPPIGTRAAPGTGEHATNLWELVKSGGWAMVPLGLLSVLTVMLVLGFWFTMRRGAIVTPHFMNTADVLLKKRDHLGLLAISSRHSETVARIVQRTLDFQTKNPGASFETIREIAETEGGAQAAALQHRITYLADIGVLAPMIGLLGTVLGIIRSFGVLGAGNTAQSRDILLASGVSEALVATAGGLILGIVAMGFYGLFRNKAHALISDLEVATAHLLGLLAGSFGKKREASRVAVEEEF